MLPSAPFLLVKTRRTAATDSNAFLNFQARTSLDGTHTAAYRALLNGLTTDGLFNSDGSTSFFDGLYIFATQDSTTALLNLVNGASAPTTTGSVTFTTDRGFSVNDNDSNNGVVSNINVGSGSFLFQQNSAHVSVWSANDFATTSGGGAAGLYNSIGGALGVIQLYPRFSDGKAYFRINDAGTGQSAGVTEANSQGFYLENRSGSGAQQGYKTAVDQGVGAVTSGVLNSIATGISFCAINVVGTGLISGYGGQVAGGSFGTSLSSTQVTNLYNRLRTYMTAVGVP